MPQQFGRFWLHEKIGHGATTEIFRATVGPTPDDSAFDVAVKRIKREHREQHRQVLRLEREALAGQYLSHPNVVTTFESGRIENLPYLALEYVWGLDLERLSDLVRRRGSVIPVDLAVYMALQCLRALDYIHRARDPDGRALDLVHRDITPSNIFLSFDGAVKIGDLGVAEGRNLPRMNEPGFVEGKLGYLSPEVLAGDPGRPRDDVFSLAVTLYEIVGGGPLTTWVNETDIQLGMAPAAIPPLYEVNPDVDRELSRIIGRAVGPQPSRRPREAADLYQQLKQYLQRQGFGIGAEAMAHFVRAMTGTTGASGAGHDAADSFFTDRGYVSPEGRTLTQRIMLVHRQRRRGLPIAIGVATAVGLVALALALF